MPRFPQLTINVPIAHTLKTPPEDDPSVAAAAARARSIFGNDGRLLIRPSGTEPLIRVMAECRDEELMRRVVCEVADVIREQNQKSHPERI